MLKFQRSREICRLFEVTLLNKISITNYSRTAENDRVADCQMRYMSGCQALTPNVSVGNSFGDFEAKKKISVNSALYEKKVQFFNPTGFSQI